MRNTENLNLALYDASDKMIITAAENSLNHNMELIDAEVAKKMSAPEGGTGEDCAGDGACVRQQRHRLFPAHAAYVVQRCEGRGL